VVGAGAVIALPETQLELGGDLRVFLITTGVVFVFAPLGVLMGRRSLRRQDGDDPKDAPIVGAVLGLLAFILAFTFGLAASLHQDRNQLVLDHANAIGTADLRASLLPPEPAAEVHALLLEYVGLRLEVSRNRLDLDEFLPRADALNARLWELGRQAALAQPASPAIALFLASLNDTFDIHASRLAVSAYRRIPVIVWVALYLLVALSVLVVGYESGLGRKPSVVLFVVLVLTFSTVIMLIADLDEPNAGLLQVIQQPLDDVHRTMQAAAGR
jgi:hypothetical protein